MNSPKPAGYFALTFAKWLFFLMSFAFMVRYAGQALQGRDRAQWVDAASTAATFQAALPFAATAILGALAWRQLLIASGHRIAYRDSARILFRTMIAKYLPGNIGHHVGRGALAKSELGIPLRVTLTTIAQESVLATIATTFVGISFYKAGWSHGAHPEAAANLAPIFALLACFAIGLILLGSFLRKAPDLDASRPNWKKLLLGFAPPSAIVSRVFVTYLASNLLNVLAVVILAYAIASSEAQDIMAVCGAYLLSWIIGFLLPGAPGGLGVREAAFIMMLDERFPPTILLALAISLRVANVFADVLIFLVGLALTRADSGPIR